MGVTFQVARSAAVYVERININEPPRPRRGHPARIPPCEGDPFIFHPSSPLSGPHPVAGILPGNLEIEQEQGSGPDRVVLGVEVEERSTGQSRCRPVLDLERFLVNLSIQQRNFRGRGQEAARVRSTIQAIQVGRDRLHRTLSFDRNIALGFDITGAISTISTSSVPGTSDDVSTGQHRRPVRAGVPITENISAAFALRASRDEVSLSEALFFSPAPAERCSAIRSGRPLPVRRDREPLTSTAGYSWSTTRSTTVCARPPAPAFCSARILRASAAISLSAHRLSAARYWSSAAASSSRPRSRGVHPQLDQAPRRAIAETDRSLLPRRAADQGFDIRGVGPRIRRAPFQKDAQGNSLRDTNGNFILPRIAADRRWTDRRPRLFVGRAEVEIPLGASARESA